MQHTAETPPLSPAGRVAAAARALAGTVQVACALVEGRRGVDLTGLERHVGRLCAAALDLPPAEGREVRPLLAALLVEIDHLQACLAGQIGGMR
jgi:hypothetical protein